MSFKENFNFITNIGLLLILVFGGAVWAETNGVWHYTEDIRGGVFGEDERETTSFYTFIDPVNFFENASGPGITINETTITFPDGSIQNGALPSGAVVMFMENCPVNWTEVEELRNKFPRGQAIGDGNNLSIGGTDDSIVVRHDHIGSTGEDTHSHGGNTNGAGNHNDATAHGHGRAGSVGEDGDHFGILTIQGSNGQREVGSHSHSLNIDEDTHTHSVAVENTGDSGIGMNVPEYQEVIFCMKN
jgi:hypothetical protein